MHRIPGSPRSPVGPRKQPVFLMHGILDTSATWVLMGPNQGLGEYYASFVKKKIFFPNQHFFFFQDTC